jgi:ubiquinone/menaquinone biosynthesis C-methylase UbiE
MTDPSWLHQTRRSYDLVAADYAELLRDELGAKPVDRAMLAAFVELVQAGGGGPVADLGCGPGRITGHLAALGLDVHGVDLSSAMVEVARQTYPELGFVEGSRSDLDIADGELAGIVAWYSVIHTPTELLPEVFAEFARVLRPGGQLLVAFQAGSERVRLEQAYGHPVSLVVHRRSPEEVTALLRDAGLHVHARLVREPEHWEKCPQAYLLARR